MDADQWVPVLEKKPIYVDGKLVGYTIRTRQDDRDQITLLEGDSFLLNYFVHHLDLVRVKICRHLRTPSGTCSSCGDQEDVDE